MTKRLSLLALMICMAGSLAFAGDGVQSGSYPAAAPATTPDTSGTTGSASETPASTTKEKKNKKDKKKTHEAKPAPTKEEQEFDHMLLGIHG
jgi:hypothetical protein